METNLTEIIKKVRTAVLGREVRSSIADGLEYCGQISENAKADMDATAEAAKEAIDKTAEDAKNAIESNAASVKEQLSKDIDAKAAAALESIPEEYTELDGSVKRLKEDIDDLGFQRINYFNKNSSEVLVDKYCQDSNGNVEGENIFNSPFRSGAGYLITNVIKVSHGDVVRCNGSFYGRNGVIANSDETIIGILQPNTDDFLNGYVVPDNVAYIRIIVPYNTDGLDKTKNSLMVTINMEMPSTYYAYSDYRNSNLKLNYSQIEDIPSIPSGENDNQWKNKVACSIGSSLTQMGIWNDIVKKHFGFSKWYNRGVGSTTLANFSGYNITSWRKTVYRNDSESSWTEENASVFSDSAKDGYSQIEAFYGGSARIDTLPENADLVVVDLATNDAYNSIQNPDNVNWETFMKSQTIPDYWNGMTTDLSTFEGAFYNMVKLIQVRCPNARIVVWGMLVNNLFTTKNDYLEKYYAMYERIEKLCRLNGIIFIDTLMYEGANWFNFKNEYHTDSVHPATTDVAIRGVANAIIGTLKNVYPKNYLIN